MTSKDKALDLQYRMKDCLYSDGLADAKQCALICVEEILNSIPTEPSGSVCGGFWDRMSQSLENAEVYWQKVKKELLNM